MTTLYKLSIHSQSLEMRGIFLVSRYVGTINQLSVRQKFFCWFSLVFQKESAIQLSKPILQHLQGGPLFMNHPVVLTSAKSCYFEPAIRNSSFLAAKRPLEKMWHILSISDKRM